MKQNIFKNLSVFLLITGAILSQSCKDEWNDHYKNDLIGVVDGRLANNIQADTTLSAFYRMLVISGYDTILNQSQTYTVWAPINKALVGIDTTDTDLCREIVRNHITRFSISTAGIKGDTITMLNGKLIPFSESNSGYLFGNIPVLGQEVLTNNGIIHKISGYYPYICNIYEYIKRTEGLDSLEVYVNSQIKSLFLLEDSKIIGSDSLGNSIYDSSKIDVNVLFNKIGQLGSEDSVYTAILPNNSAWTLAYNKISPYFVSNDTKYGPKIQRSYTCYSIVRDMVFRQRIYNPKSFNYLTSSTGNLFQNTDTLFGTASAKELSNGLAYVTDTMHYKDIHSWFKEIRVEAEDITDIKKDVGSASIYYRNSYGNTFDVSEKSYIYLEPINSTSKASVDITIRGMLSARYNIYCVFVPGTIVNASDKKPYRVSFYLFTWGNYGAGKLVQKQFTVPVNVTDTVSMTKMLVAANYKFPNCNLSLDYTQPLFETVKIRVQNEVTSKPADKLLNRAMRIDCIILEPISE